MTKFSLENWSVVSAILVAPNARVTGSTKAFARSAPNTDEENNAKKNVARANTQMKTSEHANSVTMSVKNVEVQAQTIALIVRTSKFFTTTFHSRIITTPHCLIALRCVPHNINTKFSPKPMIAKVDHIAPLRYLIV